MNRRAIVIFVALFTAVFSFFLGRNAGAARNNNTAMRTSTPTSPAQGKQLCDWLKLSDEQAKEVTRIAPDFEKESGNLQQAMELERTKLCRLLEDIQSTDEQVLAQVEKVTATHDELERAVARYLLKIRKVLSPQQSKQLMGLAASGVRDCGRHMQMRRGQSEDGSRGFGRGEPGYRGGR